MGLRFSRRLTIAPGLTLNLSKRGASVSAGVPGARFTVGSGGVRETVGLPGTGLSYTEIQGPRRVGKGGIVSALVGLLILYLIGYAVLGALGLID